MKRCSGWVGKANLNRKYLRFSSVNLLCNFLEILHSFSTSTAYVESEGLHDKFPDKVDSRGHET